MTDKFIHYEYKGQNLKVPVEQQLEFESRVPSAKMMLTYNNQNCKVPLSELDTFTKKVGADKLTYSAFDDKKEYTPSLSTRKYTPFEEEPNSQGMSASMSDLSVAEEENANNIADILTDPTLSRREKRRAKREARRAGEMPTWGETAVKSTGSALTSTGKMAVDLANEGSKMGRKRAIANNPLTGLAATIEALTGKSVLDEDNPLNEVSKNLGETAQRLSQEADPTGGEMSFGELLKSGHIGLAMQKGLGSTIESAPMMLATKNPYVAGLYMAGMAASNYADESRDNPDIPEWKRAINSVGSAAFEMAVEKLIDIPWKYFKNAGGEITEGVVQEVLERAAEEGTQTIAKRIKRALKNTAKDAVGEGFEEVITSLGNDALGSALDAMDGNKDYGFKAQWEEYKKQNPDATIDDFSKAKGREYVESFLGGALSSIYMSGFANIVKESKGANRTREFNQSYVDGASLDYEDMYDTNDDVNTAIDNAVSASVNAKGETTLTREFIENLSADEALALSLSDDVNARQQEAFKDLANQRAKQNGLIGKLDDRTAGSINKLTTVVQQASENGIIVSGVHGDKVVFVKGGVVKSDGTISLPNGQSGPVIVFDGGNKYTVDSSEISGAWSTDTENYIKSGESSIRDRDAFLREEFLNRISPKAKAKAIKQYLNTKILINTEEGVMTQVEVQAILPSGQVLVKGKKGDLGGQSERLFGPAAFYDAIARNEDGSPVFVENLTQQPTQTSAGTTEAQEQAQTQQPVTQPEPKDFRDSEQTILINGIPTNVEVTNQDDAADRITYTYTDEGGARKTGSTTVSGFEEAIKQAEAEMTVEITEDQLSQQNTIGANPDTLENGDSEIYVKPRKDEEEVNPSSTTGAEQIPLEPQSINWDALFDNDTDAYFAEMQNQFGDKTSKRLGAVVAATQKKLDALNKATPETDNEIFENEEKKEKLEAKIDALNKMIARLSAEPIEDTNASSGTEQVAPQDTAPSGPINEPNPTIPEPQLVEPAKVEKDPEPRNAIEFAARELGLRDGEIKLLWDSFKHHTGYGNNERSKFFGLFRTKEKGGMTLEEAGERLMEMDREYNTGFFDQNDPNAGLDAILTAISSNGIMGELRSYTRRQHEADSQREADETNAFIMNAYNEALLDEEVTLEDVAEKDLTEDEYNELITKFAEEIYDYEEANKRDALAVSEAEEIGDLPLATGETVRGGEGSDSVLQETQPIQARGEGTLDEESEGVDEHINREDADSPVYGGEPSVSEGVYPESEAVSSLDEDMPDFTGKPERIPLAPNQVADPIAEAKKIEKHLATQLERDLSKEQKQDLARSLGKKVADLFATREAYDEYQETATDFGTYNSDFDEGVEDSFEKRGNQQQISNKTLGVNSAAQQLTVDALKESLDGYIETEVVSDEQAQAMLDVRDELSNIELMTVYHGSPHKFDAFDHSHMGEGEGAQAHGWGTYVAKSRETSVAYARMGRVTYVGPKVNYGSYEYEVVEDITAIMRNGNTFDEAIQIGRRYWNNLKWEPSHRAKRAFLDTLKPEHFQLRSLYTVEIPEDNGSNYFDERTLSKEQTDKFVEACEKEGIDWVEVVSEASEPVNILNNPNQGKRLYNSLIKTLGSDKAASEFLSRAGFVGIKYDGRRDGECFVIFNESDAKITDRVEFYQTPNGTIYGWTDGKKIYLTKAGINPNTPIHEYTHIWAKAMMQKNPKGWNSIKQLLKGTPIWNEVVNDPNYSNIKNDDDAIASEALSRISGSKNAANMEQMAQKMIDEAKGTARKLEARGLIQNMKDALTKFWKWVGKNMFEIENFKNIDEVTDRVLYDLLNKTDLGTLSEGQVETQIVTDPQVIEELEASPKITGFRNVVQNEDGTFSSPMAYWLQSTKEGAKSRVETAKFELGKWEEAEEHPELVDENGKVTLVKPNKSTVDGVAYDPYIHNRLEPVNLQFKDAWKRDDLVYVETEVAENDLNDGYHADKALLPVGIHSWSNGDVMLSRYDKPVRIMPWEEVADAWAKRLNGDGVHFDVVPPAMRSLLVERGVEILPPHKGMGKDCNDAYAEWKKNNSTSSDRSDAVTGNSSSGGLSPKGSEHLSRNSHAQKESPAKIAENTARTKNSIKKTENKGEFDGDMSTAKDAVRELAKVLKLGKSKKSFTYYGEFYEGDFTINGRDVKVRLSAHPARGDKFGNQTFDDKVSIVIYDDGSHVSKAKHNGYTEYTYYPSEISLKDAAWAIINGIKSLLEGNGFVDVSGKAVEKKYPYEDVNGKLVYRKGENNTKFVEQLEFKQNNEQRELEYSDEFRRLQEESARMAGQMVSRKKGVQQTSIRELVGRIGGTLQRELDRARSGRGYKLRTLVNGQKGTSFDIVENVDGRLFHDIFEIVRTYLPNGELVDLHDNYNDAICYITSDGLAGFAVDANGNLISVFSLYGDSKKGFLGAIKDLITEAGATHLDGYNSPKQPLAKIYSKVFGWKVASMMDYNMEYDHDNIAENHEMPQVAFMVNTDADIETKHFDKDQYDEAVAYQQEQVEVSKRVDTQNATVDRHSGKTRRELIRRAVNEEAAKLGVKVTYKTREEMPTGHKNDKGYYNPQTGEIVICTENATSIADAIKTILHEAVAHKGLRKLFGNRFDEFIRNVYDMLDAETKAKVDARAAAHYNGDTAVAMEEYMASIAENENFADQTIWEKIKSIFTNLINDILGRNDIKIGDNELRYILRASYNNIVNPRSMDTIEGWAKDQLMREEYKVNESTPEILSRTGVEPTEVAATSARQVYDKVVSDNWNEFQRQFQDAYQPVRVAIDAIQAETGNIPIEDYENYLLAQNQSSSRSRVEIDNFQRKYYSPIIKQVNKIIDEIMKSRGWDKKDKKRIAEVYQEVRQYLIAKHGLERNAYYQNAKGEMRDFAGLTGLFGLPDTEYALAETLAQDMVDRFEAEIGDTDRDALWDKINSATDKTLRHSYESGLISRQQYNDIKGMFNFYIPLRGFDETTAEYVYSYARFEGNRFNPAVYKAEGRSSVADDPIATIMNMAESEIAQGNKNRAKQALYNYLINRASSNNGQNTLMQLQDVWYVISTDAFGNQVYQIVAPDFAAGETYEQFEARMQALEAAGLAIKSKKGKVDVGMKFQKPTHRNAHYVYLKINGVDKAIFINGDPKAADAINGTFQQKKQFAEDKMRQINRFISSTFTNYSLEFTARNYFRDMFYSHINIGVRESDPAYRKKFRQNWRRNNLGSMIKMLTAYRSGEYDSRALTADEAAFVEFMNNGGQTGYTLINSVEAHKKDLQNAIERMQKGVDKGGIKDSTAFKYTLGAIELLNEASELVTRFAAFKTSRDMGRSVETAISDAKEITVNFNTKGAQDGTGFMGAVARYFGWSKYFFNASVQGVQNIKAMAEANKLKFCGVVGGMIATGFGMPILTSLIFEMLGGGDDEEYWNIPEYDRQNNLCIALGNGKYVKIPLPIGFREVYAIGDMVAAMLMDKKFSRDFMQVGTDIANKISSVVLPVNPLESSANGLSIMHSVAYVAAPSSAQFVIQELSNTDWKGAPLQKEYTYNENDPQWMKAYASNPEWMVMLSKWCNEHIGAGDMKGWDWSPEKLDNRLSSLLGGVYTLIKKSGRSISMIWNEEQRNLSNVPLVGVALGSGIDSDDRFVTDAYFDMKKYYDERIGFIERRAEKFGLTLEDVFVNMEGGHHPKMQEVYNKDNFDFMQEWYLGNKALEAKKNKIKNEEKRAAKEGLEPESNIELAALQNEFEAERRDFVNDMLELD